MSESGHAHAGIDVSAKTLAVAFRRPDGEVVEREFKNTGAGHRELVGFLERPGGPVRVCIEWTGSYSLDVALALQQRALVEVMMVNPRVAKKFAEATRVRAKTDAVDALGLLMFVERMPFQVWTPPTSTMRELRAITRRAHDLTKSRTREKNRLAAADATTTTPASVREDIQDSIDSLSKRIEKLGAEALRLARSEVELAIHVDNLASIKGIGEQTAVAVLAELSVLPSDMTADQVVAHVGLDPRTRQSGTSVRGHGSISKRGNARVRGMLFMPAMTTVRFEPAITEFYERLLSRQKKPHVAMVAVMRRLIVTMWTLIQKKQPFDPDLFRPRRPCSP